MGKQTRSKSVAMLTTCLALMWVLGSRYTPIQRWTVDVVSILGGRTVSRTLDSNVHLPLAAELGIPVESDADFAPEEQQIETENVTTVELDVWAPAEVVGSCPNPNCNFPYHGRQQEAKIVAADEMPETHASFRSIFATFAYKAPDLDKSLIPGVVKERAYPLSKMEFQTNMGYSLGNKTRLAAALINTCDSSNGRIAYIRELQQYMDIDFYGACGDLPCDQNEGCSDRLFKQYKFFMSFEDRNADDHISNQFWNPLTWWDTVPVVMGGSDVMAYEKVAPPRSYVNTAWFYTARDLASYLSFLDDSRALYTQFMEWRAEYTVQSGEVDRQADPSCPYLHT